MKVTSVRTASLTFRCQKNGLETNRKQAIFAERQINRHAGRHPVSGGR
jgi:hypothetical protein